MAVVAGWMGGSILNMGLVQLGHSLLPLEGVDPNDMDALAEVMPTLDMEFFMFPFLAHALGTLLGAIISGKIAATHKMYFSLGIGVLFLLGGIAVNVMIPGPTWFAVLDITIAYIPMAWIGFKISKSF